MIHRQRKQIRLKNFDYSSVGYYFITICTKNRECWFGEIVDGKIVLNKAGLIINKYWLELQKKFKNISLDIFQIMPNHIHGIIIINVGNDLRVVPNNNKYDFDSVRHIGRTLQNSRQQQLLFRIIQWFKTMTTNEYIKSVIDNEFPRFDKRLWQKSFYDHIIRNEESLNNIREYIQNNPKKWVEDEENPKNIK
jgi:putative transposase